MFRQRLQRWIFSAGLTLAVAAAIYFAGSCNAPKVAPKEASAQTPWFEDVTAQRRPACPKGNDAGW
jgi:hypothetical protein